MNDGSLRYIPLSEPEHVPLLDAPHHRFFSKKFFACIFACTLIVSALYAVFVRAPQNFPLDTILSIHQGETLSGVSGTLAGTGALRSQTAFKIFFVMFGGAKGLKAGDYYLDTAQGAMTLAWRMTHSDYGLKNIKVTIPEGWTSMDIATYIAQTKNFVYFDEKAFLKLSAPYEGYLFPDTYLFLPNVTAQNILDAMLANYKVRIETLSADIKAFGKPIKDVITMASIIEQEARTEETRRTIAGILWKRLAEKMPLQVDAAFAFVNGKKASSELTLDDLKIDSPYNTYVYRGLPPGPIANPGLNSIYATIHPLLTKYYFYLSDKEGNMHYAITHDEHVQNKFKYLK